MGGRAAHEMACDIALHRGFDTWAATAGTGAPFAGDSVHGDCCVGISDSAPP